jgi:hypothetical protein
VVFFYVEERCMSTAYKGRHSGGTNRGTPAGGKARTLAGGKARTLAAGKARTPAAGKARTKFHGRTTAFSGPLVSAAAILAVAGVSAAASSQAAPYASGQSDSAGASFTASPMAVAQSIELSHNRDDTNVALAAARRSGVQRASALASVQKAEADAAVQARTQAAQAQVAARAAAADLVARAQARQALLDRAQSDPRAVATLLASDRGWGAGEFSCLDSLWTKESGWNWSASNGNSGPNSGSAYGIPQSLPGSKMASMGADWATNPVTQIKWGLQYISDMYGTPCSAWGHSQALNWY